MMYRQPKVRVLCVDDEPAICDFLRMILGESGDFLVETDTDSFAALAHAQRFKPDLIVLDINMPGQNGFELAAALRQEPWLRHRPIIFYSGMNPRTIPSRAGIGGAVEFVPKGGPPAEIEAAVRRQAGERLTLYAASQAELRRFATRTSL